MFAFGFFDGGAFGLCGRLVPCRLGRLGLAGFAFGFIRLADFPGGVTLGGFRRPLCSRVAASGSGILARNRSSNAFLAFCAAVWRSTNSGSLDRPLPISSDLAAAFRAD